MKKFIAIFLILLMVTATASAAEWEAGLGPNRPYENMPEIDFEQNIGYMFFHPNTAMSVAGSNMLLIYMPREDVKAGAGTLTLFSSDEGEEFSVSMDDTAYVIQRTMFEDELADLLWGSGTCFEVLLPVSLRAGTTYYVNLEKDSIFDEARSIGNPDIISDAQTNWHFTTIAEYGVSAMEYRRPVDEDTYEHQIIAPRAGDEVRFDLLIGGDVKCATIVIPQSVNGCIDFEKVIFWESCEVVGQVTGDAPIWDVIFWDTEVPPTSTEEINDHAVAWLEF